MDTRMASSYANFFMKYLEQELLNMVPKKPKLGLRFIDDIFMLWQHGRQELDIFVALIYKNNQSIKFTMIVDEIENYLS